MSKDGGRDGGGGTYRSTSAWRALTRTTASVFKLKPFESLDKAAEWYHDNVEAVLGSSGKADKYTRAMLEGEAHERDVLALKRAVLQDVVVDMFNAAAMAMAFTVGSEDEIMKRQQQLRNRRDTFGVGGFSMYEGGADSAAETAASSSEGSKADKSKDEESGASASAAGAAAVSTLKKSKEKEKEEAFRLVESAIGEEVEELLKTRSVELSVEIRAAFNEARVQVGKKQIDMRALMRPIPMHDAGAVWLLVCRECFLPHRQLTADKAADNFVNQMTLADRAAVVQMRFQETQRTAGERWPDFAARLKWHEHAYAQVGMSLLEKTVELAFMRAVTGGKDKKYKMYWERVRAEQAARQAARRPFTLMDSAMYLQQEIDLSDDAEQDASESDGKTAGADAQEKKKGEEDDAAAIARAAALAALSGFKGNCLTCGKFGHKATDCRATCDTCNQRGHSAAFHDRTVAFKKRQAAAAAKKDREQAPGEGHSKVAQENRPERTQHAAVASAATARSAGASARRPAGMGDLDSASSSDEGGNSQYASGGAYRGIRGTVHGYVNITDAERWAILMENPEPPEYGSWAMSARQLQGTLDGFLRLQVQAQQEEKKETGVDWAGSNSLSADSQLYAPAAEAAAQAETAASGASNETAHAHDGWSAGTKRAARKRAKHAAKRSKQSPTKGDEREARQQTKAQQRWRAHRDLTLGERILQPATLTMTTPQRGSVPRPTTPELRRISQRYLGDTEQEVPAPPSRAEVRRMENEWEIRNRNREKTKEQKESQAAAPVPAAVTQPAEQERAAPAMAVRDPPVFQRAWTCLADSGASCHIHRADGSLIGRKKAEQPKAIWGVSAATGPLYMDTVGTRRYSNSGKPEYVEQPVYESAESSANLSSIATYACSNAGAAAFMDDRTCRYVQLKPGVSREEMERTFVKLFDVRMTFPMRNNVYEYRSYDEEEKSRAYAATVSAESRSTTALGKLVLVRQLHEALSHAPYRQIKEDMRRRPHDKAWSKVKDVEWTAEEMQMHFPCEACRAMKIKKKARATYSRRTPARYPMQYVFIDASGLIRWDWSKSEPAVKKLWETVLLSWDRFALMVDAYSSKVFVRVFSSVENTEKVGQYYMKQLRLAQREVNQKTQRVYADRGGENKLKEFAAYCAGKGIKVNWAPTGEKEVQGQVEVYMGIGWRGASTLCYHANLHPVFAVFALKEYFEKLCRRAVSGQTESRNEKYYGYGLEPAEKARVAELDYGESHVLFSDCIVMVDPSDLAIHRSKAKQDGKGHKAIYVGKPDDTDVGWQFLVVDDEPPFLCNSSNAEFFDGRFTFAREKYHYGRKRSLNAGATGGATGSQQQQRQLQAGEVLIGFDDKTGLPTMDGCELTRLLESGAAQPGMLQLHHAAQSDSRADAGDAEDDEPAWSWEAVKDALQEVADTVGDDTFTPAAEAAEIKTTATETETGTLAPARVRDMVSQTSGRETAAEPAPRRSERGSTRAATRASDSMQIWRQTAVSDHERNSDADNSGDDASIPAPVQVARSKGEDKERRRTVRNRKSRERRRRKQVHGLDGQQRPDTMGATKVKCSASDDSADSSDSKSNKSVQGCGLQDKERKMKCSASDDSADSSDSKSNKSVQGCGLQDKERKNKRVQFKDPVGKESALEIDVQLGNGAQRTLRMRFDGEVRADGTAYLTLAGPANADEFYSAQDVLEWIAAKNKEDGAIQQQTVYTLVPLEQALSDVKKGKASMHRSRYVNTEKQDSDGNVKRKTRHVVQEIRTGPVKSENYAPVVQTRSFRMVMAVAKKMKMKLRQVDFNNAFLHALLEDQTVYVEFPKGYERPAGADGMVMKLNKSLYGLQCAPRRWYDTVSEWIVQQDWQVSSYDACVFYRKTESGGFQIFSLHVDDQCGGTTQDARDIAWFEAFVKRMNDRFGIKDLGVPRYVLGVDMTHDEKTGNTWLTQHTFIRKALEEYGLMDMRFDAKAPEAHKNARLMEKTLGMTDLQRQADKEKREQYNKDKAAERQRTPELYRRMVGTLLFATYTRPDIAHAVGMLGRMLEPAEQKSEGEFKEEKDRVAWKKRQAQKTIERENAMRTLQQLCAELQLGSKVKEKWLVNDHYEAAEHLFRYLKSTMHYGLRYGSALKCKPAEVKQKDVKLSITVYSDSDVYGDKLDGKSTSGWLVLLDEAVVHWSSKKQTVVAQSTTDAENIAMSAAIREAKIMCAMLQEMGFNVAKPLVVWGDNDANNNIMQQQRRFDKKNRTSALSYHFIVDEVQQQHSVQLECVIKDIDVEVRRVDTKDNVADVFTKTLTAETFLRMRDKLVSEAPVRFVSPDGD